MAKTGSAELRGGIEVDGRGRGRGREEERKIGREEQRKREGEGEGEVEESLVIIIDDSLHSDIQTYNFIQIRNR